MKAKVFQVGLLVASIFTVSNIAHAETVSIDPLATESYSKEFNVSAQEAERRLTIQTQLDYITKKLNEQFGDTIASVYFDNGQDFKLVVRTTKKGNAQKQVIDLTSQLSKQYELPIEVVANSPRNFKAIQNILKNQGERIGRQYEGFQTVAYDPQKDAIYLGFYQPDLNKQNEIKSKIKKVSGMDVVLDFMPNPITPTSVVGGGALYTSTNAKNCTAGFTGRMNGALGILTATHCLQNSRSYGNIAGGKFTFGTPITDNSTNHEISFVPLNTPSVTGEVYRYWGGFKDDVYQSNLKITGLGLSTTNATLYNGDYVGGTTLCHIGQSTGFSCGQVTQVNASNFGCNASFKGASQSSCGLTSIVVRAKQLKQSGGDSGGPYFDGSGKAYGIASSGTTAVGDLSGAIVSPVRYVGGFTLEIGR